MVGRGTKRMLWGCENCIVLKRGGVITGTEGPMVLNWRGCRLTETSFGGMSTTSTNGSRCTTLEKYNLSKNLPVTLSCSFFGMVSLPWGSGALIESAIMMSYLSLSLFKSSPPKYEFGSKEIRWCLRRLTQLPHTTKDSTTTTTPTILCIIIQKCCVCCCFCLLRSHTNHSSAFFEFGFSKKGDWSDIKCP